MLIKEISQNNLDEILSMIVDSRRIIIMGPCGAGKSTLAKKISDTMDLPVIHLDTLYYLPGWEHISLEEFNDKQVKFIEENDSWIMDGNYQSTVTTRLQAAQILLVVDPPPLQCVWRIIKRRIRFYNRTQLYNTTGCIEKIDRGTLKLLKYTYSYRTAMLPKLYAQLEKYPNIEAIHIV